MSDKYEDAHTKLVGFWLDRLLSIQTSLETTGLEEKDGTAVAATVEHLAEGIQDYLHAYSARRERQEEEELGRKP